MHLWLLCLPMTAVSSEVPTIEPPVIRHNLWSKSGRCDVKMSLMQAQIVPVENNNTIIASELKGKGYKTLIVTTGTSGKGMGAAGTNINKEIARCKEVIAAAKEEGMIVISRSCRGNGASYR